MMDLYGSGDHGGGPTRAVLDEGLHWTEPNKVVPQMKFGIAQSYFNEIGDKLAADSKVWNYESIAKGYQYPPAPAEGKISIPTWDDELYFEYHRGVFTTQANHKRNMRESEEWVLNAEKYSSLAWLNGQAYPGSELNEAWKKVLFNQFHDLAAGSGIGIIYKDAQKDYDDVRWATNEASTQALHTIQAEINTRAAGEVPLLVFNPLAWQRSGLTTVDVEMPSARAQRRVGSGRTESRAAVGSCFEQWQDEQLSSPGGGKRRAVAGILAAARGTGQAALCQRSEGERNDDRERSAESNGGSANGLHHEPV